MTPSEHYRRAEAILEAVRARREQASVEMVRNVDAAKTVAELESVNVQIRALHDGLAIEVACASVHATLAAIPAPAGGRL